MLVLSSLSALSKRAATGTTIPATLLDEWDRPDPYRLYRGPNSGDGYKMVTPMSQGLPGTPPDMGADFGLFYEDKSDSSQSSPDSGSGYDHGDPDDPFSGRQREEGDTEYGSGQQSMSWASPLSPLSPERRAFERNSDAGSIQELLRRKHVR